MVTKEWLVGGEQSDRKVLTCVYREKLAYAQQVSEVDFLLLWVGFFRDTLLPHPFPLQFLTSLF